MSENERTVVEWLAFPGVIGGTAAIRAPHELVRREQRLQVVRMTREQVRRLFDGQILQIDLGDGVTVLLCEEDHDPG